MAVHRLIGEMGDYGKLRELFYVRKASAQEILCFVAPSFNHIVFGEECYVRFYLYSTAAVHLFPVFLEDQRRSSEAHIPLTAFEVGNVT